jgi:rhamnogalacturonyl hydrolase YesR
MEQTKPILKLAPEKISGPENNREFSDYVLLSFKKLKDYCERENFKGWDPYDGLNSTLFQRMPILPKKRLTRLMWIQLFKKLPFNIRPLLGVKKGYNPKGLALFLSGYSNLSSFRGLRNESIEKINLLANQLISLRTNGYSGNCWGYNFDWESRAFFREKFTPIIVATSYAANALLDAYEVTHNEKYLNEAISSKEFIIQDLKRTYLDNGTFAFSYSPHDQTSIFNASLLGAQLLSRIYHYTKENDLKELAKKAVDYCVHFQNEDGSWYYSPLPFHQWSDSFHTGYILEYIYDYAFYTNDNSYATSFNKGMEYYLKSFFDPRGRAKYYNNSTFPVDLHSPSQLIIVLAKTKLIGKNAELVDKVLNWTIKNMQSQKGYFYYQKRRFHTIKIPYMRWTQAWMFYALSHYLKNASTSYENLV